MMRSFTTLLAFSVLLCSVFSCNRPVSNEPYRPTTYKAFLSDYNKFATRLYNQSRTLDQSNVLTSPLLSYFFLSHMYLFSDRDTQRQIREVLGLEEDVSDFKPNLVAMHTDLFSNTEDFLLFEHKMATYRKTEVSLKSSFELGISDLRTTLEKDIIPVEVVNQSFNTRQYLNNKARNLTQKEISSMYTLDDFENSFYFYLFEAINFKSDFENSKEFRGGKMSFNYNHTTPVESDSFTTDDHTFYLWDRPKDFSIFKMPLASNLSLFFFMEKSPESSLVTVTDDMIDSFSANAQEKKGVRITFPLMNFNQTSSLKLIYQRLGIRAAYAFDQSDFLNIIGEKVFFLDTKISEKLTITPEAELTSYGVMGQVFDQSSQHKARLGDGIDRALFAPNFPVSQAQNQMEKVWVIDKPFHFIVYHEGLKIILYMGYFTNPLQ